MIQPGHIQIGQLGIDKVVYFSPDDGTQLIEVSNVEKSPYNKNWFYKYQSRFEVLTGKMVLNNQPCKAKIINKTATIIELTK